MKVKIIDFGSLKMKIIFRGGVLETSQFPVESSIPAISGSSHGHDP
jgi:hypothetical protein